MRNGRGDTSEATTHKFAYLQGTSVPVRACFHGFSPATRFVCPRRGRHPGCSLGGNERVHRHHPGDPAPNTPGFVH